MVSGTSSVARLSRQPLLRRAALNLLWLGRGIDITVRHPWAGGAPMRVNLFRHKGFWFHPRRREATTMAAFARILRPGMVAFDVGAHIGWVAVQFAHLVGQGGRVLAFEPGSNNLGYLRRNLARFPHALLIDSAVGAEVGEAELFEENLTGQNNALQAPYHRLAANAALNPADPAIVARRVPVTTLDQAAAAVGIDPHLVKIDVEGFELPVLQGAAALLARARPVLMVEVTRDQAAIAALLRGAGYRLFQASPLGIAPVTDEAAMNFNIFAWPVERDPAPLLAPGDESPGLG
jgi:FkbM family methyltransferase